MTWTGKPRPTWRPPAGATALPDLAAVPDRVCTVILMLPNSLIVESVLRTDGLLSCLRPGSLVIDMGSCEPASTAALAKEAAGRHIDYVDAPVSGGVAKATTGELAIMIGGEADAVARAWPLLETLGRSLTHVGDAGSGHAAKALNNLLSATNLAAAAEILTVATGPGRRGGIGQDEDLRNSLGGMVRVLNYNSRIAQLI